MHTFEITIQHYPKGNDSYPVVFKHTYPVSLLSIPTEGRLLDSRKVLPGTRVTKAVIDAYVIHRRIEGLK